MALLHMDIPCGDEIPQFALSSILLKKQAVASTKANLTSQVT